MTLRLPEPLPYDYIDEWIDSRCKFYETKLNYPHLGGDVKVYSCEPIRPYLVDEDEMGWGRSLFELIPEGQGPEEDEQGYCNVPYIGGFKWTATEWSDEKIDRHLGIDDMRARLGLTQPEYVC